jgi:hypothetical protein
VYGRLPGCCCSEWAHHCGEREGVGVGWVGGCRAEKAGLGLGFRAGKVRLGLGLGLGVQRLLSMQQTLPQLTTGQMRVCVRPVAWMGVL